MSETEDLESPPGRRTPLTRILTRLRRGHEAWRADRLLRQVFGNASILLSGRVANAVLTLAYLAVAARGLGAEGFGILVLLHTYVQLIGQLVRFQSWQVVLTYGAPALHEGRLGDLRQIVRFGWRLDVISMAAGLLVAVAGLYFGRKLFHLPSPVPLVAALYVTSVVFPAIATPIGVLRLFNRFDLLAYREPIGSLIRLVGAGAAFLSGSGVGPYLVVWFIASAAANLLPAIAAVRELGKQGLTGHEMRQETWRASTSVWKFAWATNFNGTLSGAFGQFGTLAVGALLGPTSAALYRVARQIADAGAAPLALLTPAIYPELARLAAERDWGRMRQLMLRSALIAGLTASGLAALLALVGPWVLRLIGGVEFEAAYPVLIVLAVAAAIEMWSFPFEPMLVSAGRPGAVLAVRLGAILLYLPSLWVLSQFYGVTGAGLSVLLSTAVLSLGLLVMVGRALRQRAAN